MTPRMKTMAALGLGLAAAASSVSAASALIGAAPAGAASSKALAVHAVKVAKVGTVLTTSAGQTLYRFTVDPVGQATCTGACAKVWPPLLLPKGDKKVLAPHGVKGLSVIHLPNGRLQVAFHGQALYRFVGDKKKGQAKGQGVENDWFAVLSNGTSSAPAVAPTSSTVAPGTTATTATTAPKSTSTPTTAPKSPVTTPPTSPPVTTTPPTSPPPPPTTTTTTAPVGGGAGF
ncbi:MAG TPA: hypothetical protein VHV57_02695 [Acidimicrobiales bacterium]|nr:hypothetical protein [Acidimicrobiales bacterium]